MSGDVSIKIDKFPFCICAQHLVLKFLGFFFNFEEKLVIQGEPNELPHPNIVNLFFNLICQTI